MNTEYFHGHSAEVGTRTEFPLRFQITSIYGNTYRKAKRRGTSPPNVTFFAKAAGPRVRQESSGRAPGLLQAPSSCSDSRGWTPISGRGWGRDHVRLDWQPGRPRGLA